jgi:hypothetical protein
MKKSLCSLSFLLAWLPAQEVSPFRFAPADSAFVMRIAAPAKWKQRFAKTEIAKVTNGENFGPMLIQMTKQFDQAMAQLRESGKVDAELLDKFLADYKGDMVLAVQVDISKLGPLSPNVEAPPPFQLSLALTPDGSFDLAALGKEFERLANEDGGPEMRELAVGDHRLRFAQVDDGVQMALPTMIDGHLVMFGGNDLEKGAMNMLKSDPFTHASAKGNPPLFVYMAAGSAMDAILAMAVEQAGEMLPVDIEKIWQLSGLGAMEDVSMFMDADGKQAVGDMSVAMRGSELGFFGAMMGNKAPKLLRNVPANSENFSVGHFSLPRIYDVVGRIWAECEEAAGMTFDEAQQAFSESTKLSLKTDLIDHIGDEVITLQDPAAAAEEEVDEDDPMAGLAASCFGVSLKNGKAFGESIDKMLRAMGMHAARKSEDYQGTKIWKMAVGGLVELEYATTDDLLLLAVGKGESARQSLRAILDTRATPLAEGEVPAIAKAHAQALPAGWCGLGTNAMGPMVLGMANAMETVMEQADDEVPEQMQMFIPMLKALGTDLEKLKIQMVSATYTSPQAMQVRFRM